jgi:hypothetical protein
MRLVALSNEQLNPWVNWATLGPPLLCALTDRDNAVLASPPPLQWGNRAEWRRILGETRRADTLFWMQNSSRPELPVWLLSATLPRARRSALVIDAWRPALAKIGALAVAQRLDPCFVAYREGCEELQRRFPRGRFEWMPVGVDTDYFKPGAGERDVFVYWMGRRSEPLHRALLRYCAERGLAYRYTREEGGAISDLGQSGAIAGRSRYFVVTPPDLDNPVRTGGFSPLVMRYLEGLSAGSRLLGVLPRSGDYDMVLPRDAMLEVAPDGSDLAAKLDADMANGGAREAVARACALVRTHHSWASRAEQIHARLSRGRVFEPAFWHSLWARSIGIGIALHSSAEELGLSECLVFA